MLDVQANTPTRLVIKLTKGLNVSTAILDKSTGRARFERAVFFWKRKPVDVALDDIESVAAMPVRARGGETQVPLIRLKSGGTIQLADAGGQGETVEAVRQMRTFLGLAPSEETAAATAAGDEPATAPAAPLIRWAIPLGALALVVALAFGGARLAGMFRLPDCDAELPRTAIKDIFAEKKIKLDTLADVKSLSSEGADRTCQARADVAGGFFNLDYRIEWDGWQARTTITRAEAMAKIEPSRLSEIRRAVGDFLALARDSHTTGRPPRQSEPAVKALLDTVFDTSDLDGATLAASDIGRAMDWFNTGERIGVVYMLAGTGVGEISRLPDDPRMQQRAHRNIAEFAPEFARYLDFQIKLAGAMADAVLRRNAGAAPDELEQPQVKKELAEVRATLRDAMIGDLTSLAYEGVSDEWRRDRLAPLMEAAPKAAKVLDAEQARGVRQHALNVLGYVRNTFVQDTLKAFAEQVAAQ
jgi:hypothetical protein